MKVLRKTLVGNSEAYEFGAYATKFLVKNLSDESVLVNYENITSANETTSIKIPSSTAQIVFDGEELNPDKHNKIYIKGTGEVEVQCI